MSLLLDTFQEACQDLAFDKASGSRGKIEPPARFVLDELSNIEKWPGLRNAITQGGGNGYQPIIVEQSRQQMADEKDGYGKAVEQTVWENCHRMRAQGRVRRRDVEMVDRPDRHAPPHTPRIKLESGPGAVGRSDHTPRT